PPFFIREYHFEAVNLKTLIFSPPSSEYYTDGDNVQLTLTASTDLGVPVVFSASNLPPGLSLDPNTGIISGTIAVNDNAASPYSAVVTASAAGVVCSRTMTWDIRSAIDISFPSAGGLVGHEGMAASFGPFTTTNAYNRPVTLMFSGLPPGLSYNAATGMVSGV